MKKQIIWTNSFREFRGEVFKQKQHHTKTFGTKRLRRNTKTTQKRNSSSSGGSSSN
jgi:hypothetical protein